MDPGERLNPQTSGSIRKAESNNGLNVDTTSVCSPALELVRGLLWSLIWAAKKLT